MKFLGVRISRVFGIYFSGFILVNPIKIMNKTNNRPVVNHPKNLSNSTESAHTPDTTPTRSSPSATGQFSYAQLAKQNLAKSTSTDSKAANSHSKSNGTTPQQNTPKSSNSEAK
jgi:hypothetical protein